MSEGSRCGLVRWLALAVTVICVPLTSTLTAAEESEPLTLEERVRWTGASAWIAAEHEGDRIDGPTLRTLATRMRGFTPVRLRAMSKYERLEAQPEPAKVRLQHALRSLAWFIELNEHLERGEEIALLLGAPRERAWTKAIVEILREPFGPRLAPVVEALLRSDHGVLRAGAGRIAKYLSAFCGGHGGDWGVEFQTNWDPTSLARRVAKALLDDRNPAVACSFAMRDAYEFYDKEIADLLVANLRNEKQRPRVETGLLAGGERTVGSACQWTLDSQWIFYRQEDERPPIPGRPRPAERRVTTLPKSDAPADLSAWWSAEREKYSFRPDGKGWVTVFDGVVALRPRETRDIDTPYGAVMLHLGQYGESWIDGQPRLTIQLDYQARDDALYVYGSGGNPDHPVGYVSVAETGSGPAATICSLLAAPLRDGRVRFRLRFWTCDPDMPERKPTK